MVVKSELNIVVLELIQSRHESVENLSNVASLLHGDNSKLILLVNPHQEGLVVVVEDTSVVWPVSVQVASLEESVTFFEQEVVVDQLFLVGL